MLEEEMLEGLLPTGAAPLQVDPDLLEPPEPLSAGSVNLRIFSGAARAGKMTEYEGAPQFGKYGLAPNLKDRQ